VRNDPFGLTSKPPVIGRIVTATITLVCVLIVYDGWAALELLDVVFIVVGPIVAIFTSHLFSSSLVQQVELGRRPTIQEWLATARFESRFLLLAVPPLAVLLVLRVANVTLTDSVQVVIWLEAISLSFWAGLAAWYAGLRGRSLALSVLGGLLVSATVLLLQVFLQPGKPVKNAVAGHHGSPLPHARQATSHDVGRHRRELEGRFPEAGVRPASGRPRFVNHDDAEREFAYGGAEKVLAAAERRHWMLVSMKEDFAMVFGAADREDAKGDRALMSVS
jgi:hypothetical protein